MNKTIVVLLSVFLFLINTTFGQESIFYKKIQSAKKLGVNFENVIMLAASPDAEVLEYFENPEYVFFFENVSFDVKNIKAVNLVIPKENKNMVLELTEVPDYFYDYIIETSDDQKFPANKNIKHYRGIVQGENNSIVAITFYKDEIMGLVCTDEGNFNITKNKQSGKHLLYNGNNLKEKIDFNCGTEYNHSTEYEPEILLQERNNSSIQKQKEKFQSPNIDKNVKFYVETTYDILQAKNYNYQDVIAYIAGLFNQVGMIYENENILTSIAYHFVWGTDDQYTGTIKSTPNILENFQDRLNLPISSYGANLGILLTFKNIGGGLAAGVHNALCTNATKEKLAVARINNVSFPTYFMSYDRSVKIVTHEFGHLLNSYHTHACVWNGNNTAIDGCSGYVELGNCPFPGNPSHFVGTIMSYCDVWNNYTTVNFNKGFGLQPGNVIRNSVHNAKCLECTIPLEIVNGIYNSGTNIKIEANTINVYDANIKAGAKVELDACGSITINGNFIIEAGATFIIK